MIAATGGTLGLAAFGGIASAEDPTTEVSVDEPLATSSPSSKIAPTDGFADTDWTTDGPLAVVRVTNLDASGPGSLREAMNRDVGGRARVVVFEVGGVINLEGAGLDPETDDMFIAGQTAPDPGITIVRGTFEFDGTNIVAQHIRVRSGTEVAGDNSGEGEAADSITVQDESENIVLDHCTASWGTDENMSVGDTARRITFANSLIAHGLAAPGFHPDDKPEHSNGSLIGHDTNDMAILGNCYAHDADRNPRLKGGTDTAVVDNVVYNFDNVTALGDDAVEPPTRASIVGNVYRPGPNTPFTGTEIDPLVFTYEDDPEPLYVYLDENVLQGDLTLLQDTDKITRVDQPLVWPESLDRHGGRQSFGRVLNAAGARPAARTPLDATVIQQTRSRTGEIIDNQNDLGGYPDLNATYRSLDVPEDGFGDWLARYTAAVEVGRGHRGRRRRRDRGHGHSGHHRHGRGRYDIVVAEDGSGNYESVQSAIDAIPLESDDETRVFIKSGRYKEKLTLSEAKTNVTFIGESAEDTVLTYDDNHYTEGEDGEPLGTSGSSSFFVNGDDFTARDLTFENASEPVAQAVAIRIDGDRAAFEGCRFIGNQDTLYTHGHDSRQYYRDCYIEGDVDFIFGWATCLFEDCHIHCKSDGGYVTAASTEQEKEFGYVFKDCEVTSDAAPNSYFLGRPWRPYAQVVFMDSWLGDHIRPVGWEHWNDTQDPESAYFAEYDNAGPGYTPDQRADWSHQLTRREVREYATENIFSGWNPTTRHHG